MFIFGLHSTSDDWSDWLMDSNPIHHPISSQENEMLSQLLMISQAGQWTEPHLPPLSSQKHEMHFWITFNF